MAPDCAFVGGGHLARRHEVVVRVLEHLVGQMPHELENARVLPLMLAERLVVHEEIDDVAAAVDGADPLAELARRQRPLGPIAIGKAKSDIVAEGVVLRA